MWSGMSYFPWLVRCARARVGTNYYATTTLSVSDIDSVGDGAEPIDASFHSFIAAGPFPMRH